MSYNEIRTNLQHYEVNRNRHDMTLPSSGNIPSTPTTDTERDITLAEICGGVAQLLANEGGGQDRHIYPRLLRQGLSRLAASMIKTGTQPIQSVSDAVELMQKPLGEWDVALAVPDYLAELTLMDGDDLTEGAEALIVDNPNVADELTQGIMKRVIDWCRTTGNQKDYVVFRRFIIEHPVATRPQLIAASNDIKDESLSSMLRDHAYEIIPEGIASNGEIATCELCGWTLLKVSHRGAWLCADARCRQLQGVLPARYLRRLSVQDGLKRIRAGLARYTAQPGRLELSLYESLSRIKGLAVELWPGFDSYDIGVTFPSGEVWAVDCKDSGYPRWLAAKISNDKFPRQSFWQRACYVFPDYRRKLDPDYERVFKSNWEPQQDNVLWNFEGHFLIAVRERLERG